MNRMMALLAVLAVAGLTEDAHATAPADQCQVEAPRWDSRAVTCTLDAVQASQSFRFAATFSGSHDDTSLSLTARLNDQSLTCAAGSTTQSEGELGDVTLECRFSISAEQLKEKPTLKVLLSFRHAEYGSFDLEAI